MTEGLEQDIKDYMHNLTSEIVAMKGSVSEMHGQCALTTQRLGFIEKHLSEINGNCKTHSVSLAEHDTALALLEQRTVCALDRDCHLKDGIAKVPEVAAILPQVAENTSVLTLNLRENWLKWLIALLLVGATSAGGSLLGRLA